MNKGTTDMEPKGKVIVFEGGDGSGKATQASLLAWKLEDVYPERKIISVSFPNYSGPYSQMVKLYLGGELEYMRQYMSNYAFVTLISQMYASDRLGTFLEKHEGGKSILQWYKEGAIIVCDRYSTSNMLHQSAMLDNHSEVIDYLNMLTKLEYDTLGLPKPDQVYYLDVPPEVSIENMKRRYQGRPENDLLENLTHLSRVYEIKDMIARRERWKIIPSTRKIHSEHVMRQIEDIHMDIYVDVIEHLI